MLSCDCYKSTTDRSDLVLCYTVEHHILPKGLPLVAFQDDPRRINCCTHHGLRFTSWGIRGVLNASTES